MKLKIDIASILMCLFVLPFALLYFAVWGVIALARYIYREWRLSLMIAGVLVVLTGSLFACRENLQHWTPILFLFGTLLAVAGAVLDEGDR